MLTYLLGIAFLVACFALPPILRKVAHDRALGGLGLDGVTLIPRRWGLGRLVYRRPAWEAEVTFEAPMAVMGWRQGHLLFKADLQRDTPEITLHLRGTLRQEPAPETLVPTGDPDFDRAVAVTGDREFARRLLDPETRARLAELDALGGRLLGVRHGEVYLTGPFLARGPELRRLLEACEAIVERASVAAGGKP
jgi:hypothetical protein